MYTFRNYYAPLEESESESASYLVDNSEDNGDNHRADHADGNSIRSDRHDDGSVAFLEHAFKNGSVGGLRAALQSNKGFDNCQLLNDAGCTEPYLVIVINLFWSDRKRVTRLVKTLLYHRADVNATDELGRTALCCAVESDHLALVQLLLGRGAAQVDARDKDNRTPLFKARSIDVVRALITHGADVHAKTTNGTTPLHNCHYPEIARLLLQQGADVNAKMTDGTTPLHNSQYYPEIAGLLVQHGADVNARMTEGTTPLHNCHHLGIARLLIQHGADVNARMPDGTTPLHDCDDPEIVRLLLEHGAAVNSRTTKGSTPLHNQKNPEIVRLLLEHGADVNATDCDGHSPFYDCDDEETAQLLIDYGIIIPTDRQATLYRATHGRNLDMVRFLFKLGGIDVNARNLVSGRTLLHATMRTCQFANREIVMLLVENGADVNARERDTGLTALHRACQHEAGTMVELLMQKGSNVHARDNEGWTPLLWACAFGRWEIVKKLVLSHGANVNDLADMDTKSVQKLWTRFGILMDNKKVVTHLLARTPLSMACLGDDEEAVRHTVSMFAEYDADGKVIEREQVEQDDKVEVVQYLLGAGACVNYKDLDGSTPLLHAAGKGHYECARLLLQRGACIHAPNRHGTTPFLVACEKGGFDMIYCMIRLSPHHQMPQPF